MSQSPTAAALGIDGPVDRRRVIVRGGNKVRGDVLQFDLAQTDAATTNNNVADPNSGLVNVIDPEAGLLTYGLYGVLLENTNDDQKGYVCIEGFCDAYVISSGTMNPGDALTVTTSGNLTNDDDVGVAYKVVAIFSPLDGQAITPSSETLARVYFSGIHPLGAADS